MGWHSLPLHSWASSHGLYPRRTHFARTADVQPNVNGVPFASTAELSHSSTLRTMQQIFHVDPRTGYPWLGGAATADDLSELFRPGVIH